LLGCFTAACRRSVTGRQWIQVHSAVLVIVSCFFFRRASVFLFLRVALSLFALPTRSRQGHHTPDRNLDGADGPRTAPRTAASTTAGVGPRPQRQPQRISCLDGKPWQGLISSHTRNRPKAKISPKRRPARPSQLQSAHSRAMYASTMDGTRKQMIMGNGAAAGLTRRP